MSTNLSPQEIDRFERIANLLSQGVSQDQIALVVGMTEAELSLLLDEDDFKKVQGRCLGEVIDSNKTINEGWDHIEETAITNLIEVMKYKKDPDFLLKASLTANRATRRNLGGIRPRDPLEAQNAGARVIINLSSTFVQGLETLQTQRREITLEGQAKKQVNMLGTQAVEALLSKPTEIDLTEITVEDLTQPKHAASR